MLFIKSFLRSNQYKWHRRTDIEVHQPRFGTQFDPWYFPAGNRPSKWTKAYASTQIGVCQGGWHLAPANIGGIMGWGSTGNGHYSVWLAEISEDAYVAVDLMHRDKFAVSEARLVRRVLDSVGHDGEHAYFPGITKMQQQRLNDGVEWFDAKLAAAHLSNYGKTSYLGKVDADAPNLMWAAGHRWHK